MNSPLSITVLEERSDTLARLEALAEVDTTMPLGEALASAPPRLPLTRDTQPCAPACTELPDADGGLEP